MASNFAAIKAKARRDVHASLSVAARYENYAQDVIVDDISVRWHNKIAIMGDLENGGYANVIEGIERIIFMRDELNAKGIMLSEGDSIIMTAEGCENARLVLKTQEPIVGPVEIVWQVARAD
ncbi:hypothetical protein ZT45_20930 [Salmonella enterica subsp. enterica]|nr:hypothetical protein [Salmonella enterica subsp. enterica]